MPRVEASLDYRSEAAYRQELGDDEAVEELISGRKREVQNVLGPGASEGEPKPKKAKTVHRAKIMTAGLELDNALKGPFGAGPGLRHFVVTEDAEKTVPPLRWPRLLMSTDEGPDIFGLQTWMDNQARVCLQRTPDPSHGVHGDTLLAAEDCFLGPFLYLMTLVINIAFLPWNDGKFGHQISECWAEWSSFFTHEDDPVQQMLWEELITERGWQDREGAEGTPAELHEDMKHSRAFRKLGNKVGMCRFYQLFVEVASFLSIWYTTLASVLILCLDMQVIHSGACGEALRKLQRARDLPGADGERIPTKRSSAEELRELRAACKNSLHLICVTLMEPRNYRYAAMLTEMSVCTHAWYCHAATVLRSVDESVEWCRQQDDSGFQKHLAGTWQRLQNRTSLEK